MFGTPRDTALAIALIAPLGGSCCPDRPSVMTFEEAKTFVTAGKGGEIFIHEGCLIPGGERVEEEKSCSQLVGCREGSHPEPHYELFIYRDLQLDGEPIRLLSADPPDYDSLLTGELVSICAGVSFSLNGKPLVTRLETYDLRNYSAPLEK